MSGARHGRRGRKSNGSGKSSGKRSSSTNTRQRSLSIGGGIRVGGVNIGARQTNTQTDSDSSSGSGDLEPALQGRDRTLSVIALFEDGRLLHLRRGAREGVFELSQPATPVAPAPGVEGGVPAPGDGQ